MNGKCNKKLLDHATQSTADAFQTASKRAIQKTAETLLIELQGLQNTHNKIIQKHLQMSMIKKYIKKDIYLQKKERKLLII